MFDALFLYADEAAAIADLGPRGYRDRWGRDAWDGSRVTPVRVEIAAAVYEAGDPDPETGAPTQTLVTPAVYSEGYWVGVFTGSIVEANGWKANPACMVVLDRVASHAQGKRVCAWISPALETAELTAVERVARANPKPSWAGTSYQSFDEVVRL